MSRPMWLVALIKRGFPGRFLAARATRAPILGRLVDGWLFAGDDLVYLPTDQSVREHAIRKVPVGRAVEAAPDVALPSQVVEHFIEAAGFHWIMNACLCRDASSCGDYPVDLGCLFLGDAAAGIDPHLGRRVTRDEALAHVRRCREAGLVHLVGRNKLDTLWMGVGPGDRLLTICNCCQCCCLWRMLPDVSEHISDHVTRMEGVSVEVSDRCVGCGTCADGVCFVGAIRLEDGRSTIGEACRGCGRCANVCPHGAIEISIENSQFVADTIARIAPLVDVT